jgi:predicted dehydrogenase
MNADDNFASYGLTRRSSLKETKAPGLPYRPPGPKTYSPGIGVIGCGGITYHHLNAYRLSGFRVLALASRSLERAEKLQREFFPEGRLYNDYRSVLDRNDIQVVDITTRPEPRVAIIEDALRAGKHVLSQKPFVLDLSEGQRLVNLAVEYGRLLAVNQNGRWAPHFRYMTCAIEAGLIGSVTGVEVSIQWDHSWIAGTEFEKVRHLILLDFGIHWFDIVSAFFEPSHATRVSAEVYRLPNQEPAPPLLATASAVSCFVPSKSIGNHTMPRDPI